MGLKHWKEASSVILTALRTKPSAFNYDIITLKRSAQNEFMPGRYVFPGGTTHSADEDRKWFEIFKRFSLTEGHFKTMLPSTSKLPPMFETLEDTTIPKHVSLKITAIRETFEETGILLCKTQEGNSSANWTSSKVYRQLGRWRCRIHEHPEEFINLCQHFDCYPDVVGLKLWSNWLTPRTGNPKRFDTAFYLATLEEFPTAHADESEVEKVAWFSPGDLLRAYKKNDIWLPPPQLYETARLAKFHEIEELSEFASRRESQGCERWMPQRVNTMNGSVSLLTGDEKYNETDLSTGGGEKSVNMSNEDYRNVSKVTHRIEHSNKYDGKIIISNYTPPCSHVLPLIDVP